LSQEEANLGQVLKKLAIIASRRQQQQQQQQQQQSDNNVLGASGLELQDKE